MAYGGNSGAGGGVGPLKKDSSKAIATIQRESCVVIPPLVLDHLQYASTEGEGLGYRVMCGGVR